MRCGGRYRVRVEFVTGTMCYVTPLQALRLLQNDMVRVVGYEGRVTVIRVQEHEPPQPLEDLPAWMYETSNNEYLDRTRSLANLLKLPPEEVMYMLDTCVSCGKHRRHHPVRNADGWVVHRFLCVDPKWDPDRQTELALEVERDLNERQEELELS
jgi:hypothetical protein